ncbi:MAG: valine--tRNA ligase, partial [Bryobacteraceae bacterium]|nr:valine--tRNA ligase [Bryobacteraceae bacterium]
DPKQVLDAVLYSRSDAVRIASATRPAIERLSNIRLEIVEGAPRNVEGAAMRSTPAFDLVLKVPVAQAEAQRKRLEKEIQRLEKVIASSHRQLGDETFISKAPPKVVEGIRDKLAEYEAQLAKNRAALESLARL